MALDEEPIVKRIQVLGYLAEGKLTQEEIAAKVGLGQTRVSAIKLEYEKLSDVDKKGVPQDIADTVTSMTAKEAKIYAMRVASENEKLKDQQDKRDKDLPPSYIPETQSAGPMSNRLRQVITDAAEARILMNQFPELTKYGNPEELVGRTIELQPTTPEGGDVDEEDVDLEKDLKYYRKMARIRMYQSMALGGPVPGMGNAGSDPATQTTIARLEYDNKLKDFELRLAKEGKGTGKGKGTEPESTDIMSLLNKQRQDFVDLMDKQRKEFEITILGHELSETKEELGKMKTKDETEQKVRTTQEYIDSQVKQKVAELLPRVPADQRDSFLSDVSKTISEVYSTRMKDDLLKMISPTQVTVPPPALTPEGKIDYYGEVIRTKDQIFAFLDKLAERYPGEGEIPPKKTVKTIDNLPKTPPSTLESPATPPVTPPPQSSPPPASPMQPPPDAQAEAQRKAEAEAESRRKAEAEADARRAEAEADVKRKAEAEAEAEAKKKAEAEVEVTTEAPNDKAIIEESPSTEVKSSGSSEIVELPSSTSSKPTLKPKSRKAPLKV